jgi:hypothetical protein
MLLLLHPGIDARHQGLEQVLQYGSSTGNNHDIDLHTGLRLNFVPEQFGFTISVI